MLSETVKEIIKDSEQRHRKLWMIMTVSSALWVLLGYFTIIINSENLNPRPVSSAFIYSLYIVAFGLGILSICLRYYLLSGQRIKNHIEKEPNIELFEKKHCKDKSDYESLQELNKMAKHEKSLVTLSGWILNRSVYSWGVNSMIVFTGYIVGILTKSFVIIVPFMVGALILDFIMFPMLQRTIEKASI